MGKRIVAGPLIWGLITPQLRRAAAGFGGFLRVETETRHEGKVQHSRQNKAGCFTLPGRPDYLITKVFMALSGCNENMKKYCQRTALQK